MRFLCEHCGQAIDADDAHAGGVGNCPFCSRSLTVPGKSHRVLPPPRPILPPHLTPRFREPASASVPSHSFLAPPIPPGHLPPPPPRVALAEPPSNAALGRYLIEALIATVIVGAFGCAVQLLGPAAASVNNTAYLLGAVVGYLVASAVIAGLIALVIAGIAAACKKRFGKVFFRSYTIGVVCVALLAFFGMLSVRSISQRHQSASADRASEEKAAAEFVTTLESDMKAMSRELLDADGAPKPTSLRFESNPNASNDAEKMQELIRSFFNDIIALQNDYVASLNEARLPNLMDADRVAKDVSFRESYEILGKAKAAVHKAHARADELLAAFPKKMEEVEFRSVTKEGLRSGFQKGLDKSLPLMRESWEIEVSIVELMGEMLKLLETTRDHWNPEGGKFVFERDADLEQFNLLAEKIDVGARRQMEIREAAFKSASGNLEGLKLNMPK